MRILCWLGWHSWQLMAIAMGLIPVEARCRRCHKRRPLRREELPAWLRMPEE